MTLNHQTLGPFLNAFSVGIIFLAGITVFVAAGYYDNSSIIAEFSIASTEFFIFSNLFSLGLPIAETAAPRRRRVDLDATLAAAGLYSVLAAAAVFFYMQNRAGLAWINMERPQRYALVPAVAFAIINKQLLAFYAREGREVEFGLYAICRYSLFAISLVYEHTRVERNYEYAFLVGEAGMLLTILLRIDRSFVRGATAQKVRRGLGLFISPLVFDLNMKVDYIFVLILLGQGAIERYAVASFALEGLNQIAVASHVLINHRLKRLRPQMAFRTLVARYLRLHLLVSSLLSVLALVGIYVLVLISGQREYMSEIMIVGLILVTGFLLSPMTNTFYYAFAVRGDPARQNALQFMLLSINAVLNTVLVPRYGIIGAATASSIAAIVTSSVFYVMFARSLRHSGG